jgi:hypothetical protein
VNNRVRTYLMDADGPPVLRVILPGGVGTVEIETGLTTADGRPRVRVDVTSDTTRYGPATDGNSYAVTNGDPGPGVVFVTGEQPGQEQP